MERYSTGKTNAPATDQGMVKGAAVPGWRVCWKGRRWAWR
jgi:hypothetical protein